MQGRNKLRLGTKGIRCDMEEEMKSLWWVGSFESHTEQSGLCGG